MEEKVNWVFQKMRKTPRRWKMQERRADENTALCPQQAAMPSQVPPQKTASACAGRRCRKEEPVHRVTRALQVPGGEGKFLQLPG